MKATIATLAVLAFTSLPATADESASVLDVAASSGKFNALCLAIEAAGLGGVLQGDGPFTVFAPTDEAFGKVDLEGIIGNKEALRSILTYHILPGRYVSGKVVKSDSLETVSGFPVFFRTGPDGPTINGARIMATDIEAGNGIIHVIDKVITPLDTISTLRASGRFSILLKAIEAAGLTKVFQGDLRLTILAPVDAAFRALPEQALEDVLSDPEALAAVLKNHVVAGAVRSDRVAAMESVKSLGGGNLAVDTDDGVRIGGATVTRADLSSTSGVIHEIDTVLLPERIAEKYRWKGPSEASLPEGYPDLTPPGEIRIREYPVLRGAFTTYRGWFKAGTWMTFGTLFRHIKRRDIPMTAPVVAVYPESVRHSESGNMAVGFLYPDVATGETGKAGRVHVLDLAPRTYLVIGVKGDYHIDTMRKALDRLDRWFEKNGEGWQVSGTPRHLMYQRPRWSGRDEMYSEVEIPIEKRGDRSSTNEGCRSSCK